MSYKYLENSASAQGNHCRRISCHSAPAQRNRCIYYRNFRIIQKFLYAMNVLPFSVTQVIEIEGKQPALPCFYRRSRHGIQCERVKNRAQMNLRSQQLEKDD
jgi:hypothetical protein